jgi:hypothetical protein
MSLSTHVLSPNDLELGFINLKPNPKSSKYLDFSNSFKMSSELHDTPISFFFNINDK